ncbi:MAG: FkbM family methyltransferase [Coprococcus sp.]|nr:FkbM family methyltransferase [Coprococcus sp.]
MKIIIFGAGVYGKKCLYFLSSIGVTVDFFCQTYVEENQYLKEIPILDISRLSKVEENKIIFIAINNRSIVEEIREKIKQEIKGIINIYNYCDLRPECDLVYEGQEFEIRIMYDYWNTYLKNSKLLKESRDKLCHGLLAEDIDKIDRIINRMAGFIVDKSLNCDIYTLEEKRKIYLMEQDMFENIGYKIKGDECFYLYKNYKLYERCFEANVFYYQLGMGLLKNTVQIKEKNIVDVGAYIGDSSIVLSDYTDRFVYAFEAFDGNYQKIIKNAKLNNRTNIIPINLALGESSSYKSFYLRSDSNTGHGMIQRKNLSYRDEIQVRQVTLDEYVNENDLDIGLIKVDIEGAEREFLYGAKETICSQKPTLLISIYHTADDFFELKSMIEQWGCGYSFRVFQPITRTSFLLETALICEVLL